ncbi:MAG: Nif3-like dinuclear metal center hexameric protein [bacterium]
MATIGDVTEALDQMAPSGLAEEWDNVGLLLGDPEAPCERAAVSLEPTRSVLDRAADAEAQLLVTHHPLIFRPLSRVTAAEAGGALLLEAARRSVALAAAHTNLDVAPGGVNDVLAELLELRKVEPLAASVASVPAKVVVFTPACDLDAVLEALRESGAGVIGQYQECTFRTPGIGTFRPLAGAEPTIGEVGRREEVEELRVEAVLPRSRVRQVTDAVRAAHSYEEPAIDVYELEPGKPSLGLGRAGDLPRPAPARRVVDRIKRALGVQRVRVVGDLRRRVERVGVVGGSGGDYVAHAIRRGCQLYLTGDVSHHQALEAAEEGLVVVDAGHAATEAPAMPVLARRLGERCPDVAFTVIPTPARGPFRIL